MYQLDYVEKTIWDDYVEEISKKQLPKYAQKLRDRIINGNLRPEISGATHRLCRFGRRWTIHPDETLRAKKIEDYQAEKAAKNVREIPEKKFSTFSDVGEIIINGLGFTNFSGDGINRVRIYECDAMPTMSMAEIMGQPRTRIYAPKNQPMSIRIARYDCAPDDCVVVDNVLGFEISQMTLKIYTKSHENK